MRHYNHHWFFANVYNESMMNFRDGKIPMWMNNALHEILDSDPTPMILTAQELKSGLHTQ